MGEADSDKTDETEQMIVPKVPVGISGTALAACLLRDGWSVRQTCHLSLSVSLMFIYFVFICHQFYHAFI